ncbi:MAG: diadenylate cyclase CdaA [Oscillospiraceae bacterium]|nr:diadenylate cyclase CdaA [Oscillospiraceae bacterium]
MRSVEELLNRFWLWETAKLIGISDIIDILLVAFGIYQLFRFIRKGRSGQVAKAIIIIIIAVIVANLLKLRVVSFLLNNAVELGLLSLIIIFQPEIRRFLEQMGSGKIKELFVSEAPHDELENAISETVEAYGVLSRDKVGALIVFERKTLLDDVLKTGTALDAGVSAELIRNLFWNKAPLHDGAVVVRNGRIVGAGCMLPLSGNTNLSRSLGMRHRAGIGISENSDAVVAIVSEETGSISVAINGMLKRHLAPETLDRLLRSELMPDQEEKKTTAAARITNVLKGKREEKTNEKKDPRQ